MTETTGEQLVQLKGFTFDGDTGRTLSDLYQAVGNAGYRRDAPFVMPSWRKGDARPVVLNSYLDVEGNRVHVVWQSDDSGQSQVIDIITGAPSLEKNQGADAGACSACGDTAVFHEMMQALNDE